MKIIYFDCFSGISGDMVLGAFIDAGLDYEIIASLPGKLNIPQVKIEINKVVKNGLTATKVDVNCPHEHVHRHLKDITIIINNSSISENAKELARQIFRKLAESEARVHNTDINDVHFHEVGALDAIVDIVGAAVAYDALGIKKAFVSAINVGGGMVEIAHGTYPVPAPATAYLLENFVIHHSSVKKELVTPTGAAILKVLVGMDREFNPSFNIKNIGYGAGTADLEKTPNVLRIMIGEIEDSYNSDNKLIIECNIDNMDPQIFPYLIEQVMNAGAVDAYVTPVIMKKGRPGHLFTAVCSTLEENKVTDIIFKESTTIGVRKIRTERSKLKRKIFKMDTSLGNIQVKEMLLPNGDVRRTPEFEDCKKIAEQSELSLKEIQETLMAEINRKSTK